MAYLEIHKGRTVVHLPLEDEANSIGRQVGNSIVINDKDVSRQHCVIEKWDGEFRIYDVGSRNGVVVNGQRVERAPLKSGDIITIGGTIAKFLDAPLKPAAESRSARPARLTWIPATLALIVTAAVVAWAMGLVDAPTAAKQLGARWGLVQQATSSMPSATRAAPMELAARDRAAKESSPIPATLNAATTSDSDTSRNDSAASKSGLASAQLEPAERAVRYSVIPRHASTKDLDAMLGQPVAARFVGKPEHDERGRVTWDYALDGTVKAVIELQSDAAALVLATIDNEPATIEAELAGRLMRDPSGDGFIVRVGVVEVLKPISGPEDALAEATRALIGKRIVINARYAAGNGS